MTPQELKARRVAYPLTQDELAALVDVGHSTIGHWEAGRRTPRPRFARKLQAVFGLRPWSEVDILPLCATCGIVPPARQRTECGACHMQRWRASKRQRLEALGG